MPFRRVERAITSEGIGVGVRLTAAEFACAEATRGVRICAVGDERADAASAAAQPVDTENLVV